MTKHTIQIFFFRELVDQPPHPIDHIQKLAKAVLGSKEANEGEKVLHRILQELLFK